MPDLIRFDVFEVNLRSRELRKKGIPISLQEQPFRILEILVAAAGNVVTREELAAALWPSGTFVEFDRGLNTAVNKLRVALGDSAEEPRFIETVGRRGYRFKVSRAKPRLRHTIAAGAAVIVLIAFAFQHFATNGQQRTIRSIAVLPLANLSNDRQQEFFADGMTDQLITDLAKMQGLSVISHQSVMQFKASRLPLTQIARQLGVDAVIEGSVVRSGSRVRVTAQLLDGRSDRHLWASEYEREIGDVLALQDDVAGDIAEQIGAKLVRASSPIKSTAYLLYLRGRYQLNELPPNFDPAIALFQQAIKEDANFAAAYAGLADCYATRAYSQMKPLGRANDAQTARSFAEKALRLDPTLAEAYTTLGYLDLRAFDYRFAESNFQRAIAANPNYVKAHHQYVLHLIRFKRFDEAIREARIALQLDPISFHAHNGLANSLAFAGRNAEAMERIRIMLNLYPAYAELQSSLHFRLSLLLHEVGRDSEAASEFIRSLDEPKVAPLAARLKATRGGFAEILRTYLQDPAVTESEDDWTLATLYAFLGNREGALEHLERACAKHQNEASSINADSHFDFVRADPRFQTLLAKMNLRAPR